MFHIHRELTKEGKFDRAVKHIESQRPWKRRIVLDDSAMQDIEDTGNETKEQDPNEDPEMPTDPRIHFRPIVTAIQGSNAELNQLINMIDLLKGRQFLEVNA